MVTRKHKSGGIPRCSLLSFVAGLITGAFLSTVAHQTLLVKDVFMMTETAPTNTLCSTNTATKSTTINKRLNSTPSDELETPQKTIQQSAQTQQQEQQQHDLFPSTISAFANDAAVVSKPEFMNYLDYGLPKVNPKPDDPFYQDVLILYPKPNERPAAKTTTNTSSSSSPNGNNRWDVLPVKDALESCDDVVPIYIKRLHGKSNFPCLALVGGHTGTHHLLRYRKKQDDKTSFERIGLKGRFVATPDDGQINRHRYVLRRLFNNLNEILHEIKSILKHIAKQNSVIVTCLNQGYIPLLLNYVCSCRAHGLDDLLSSLLVFATDGASYQVALDLGLAVIPTEAILGAMPTDHSNVFGDKTFGRLTYSGMICASLVNMAGYNVLFEDLDIIHYHQNPLDYFHDKNNALDDYDVVFMNDGNDGWEYQPFQPNTGFYFVRYNERTQYFMNALLTAGDLITASGVDQLVFSLLMNEHSAQYGLRVKTLDWEHFPGGREYNNKHEFVENNVINKHHDFDAATDDGANANQEPMGPPWIFHMHWTANLPVKVQYFQQSGMWYVNNNCYDEGGLQLNLTTTNETMSTSTTPARSKLVKSCCSAKPVISCHHEDRPSVKECKKRGRKRLR